MVWKVRVRCPSRPAKTPVLLETAPDAKWGDFLDMMWVAMEIEPPSGEFTIMVGHPPRAAATVDDAEVQTVISNNEVIVVQLPPPSPARGKAKVKGEGKGKVKAAAQPKGATISAAKKRKMGVGHTLGSSASSPPASPQPASVQSTVPSPAAQRTAHMQPAPSPAPAQLQATAASAAPAPPPSRPVTASALLTVASHSIAQQQVAQGGAPGAVAPRRRRKRIRQSSVPFFGRTSDEKDIGSGLLLQAVSGSGSTAARNVRSALRESVSGVYAMRQAEARVAAAAGKLHRIEVSAGGGRTGGPAIKVTYPKGHGFRGEYVDESLELMPEAKLKDVVRFVLADPETGKEKLKPLEMAACSPGFFWSVIHKYNDVAEGLRSLCPDVDWSYLMVRSRHLSAKALANAAQAEANKKRKASQNEAGTSDVEDISDSENDIVEVTDSAGGADSNVMQPSGMSPATANVESMQVEVSETVVPTEASSALIELLGEEIAQKIAMKAGIGTPRALANADAVTLHRLFTDGGVCVQQETAQEWISRAQESVLDDLMMELFAGDEGVVVVLEEVAKVGTPRDLVLMGRYAQALVETVKRGVGQEEWIGDKLNEKITAQTVEQWHKAAVALVEAEPWLEDWVTQG